MGPRAPLARVELIRADGRRQVMDLAGDRPPDLALVERLARLQLAFGRAGDRMRLTRVAPELRDLLELVGLGREMCGEAEGGEEPLGLEEGMDGGDLLP